MAEWTIQKLLKQIADYLQAKGVDSPQLSAELLLSHVLSRPRIELYTHFDEIVGEDKLEQLRELTRRAGRHEPIAYIVGRCEFYGLEIEVSRDCMIPRPETELLVERAIEFLRRRSGEQLVCDLCTGSGCIAVAIAKNFENARIIATDISDSALAVAAKNIEKYKLNRRVELLRGDLFDPVLPQLEIGGFDLIVCNPPYVSTGEYERLERNVRDYEPKVALLAGADGLEVYRRICGQVGRFLKTDGALMLEVGYNQGPAVGSLLEQTGIFDRIETEKDFNNIGRVVIAIKGGKRGI